MTIFSERRKRLLAAARGKQVVAATGSNIFYLTDFFGEGIAIAKPDRTVFVTSVLEYDRARELGHEVEVVKVKKRADMGEVVLGYLEKGKVVVDRDLVFGKPKRFKKKPETFLEARRIKDDEELARIRRASSGLDRIFESLTGVIRPGRTEWEIGAEVLRQATLAEMTPSPSDAALSPAIVAAGSDGALPHCELSDRKVKNGDFVVVDIFFRYRGYHSDSTRTFAVGTVTGEMKRAYAAVEEAQEEALGVIADGAACEDVNEAAVGVLRKHRLDRYLNHSIGHGVGVDIHELPQIMKGNRVKLEAGDVVTDEPGVYFKGKFGVRIEDTIAVAKKPVLLTRYTRDLVTVG